jgi:hypothetical protein
MGGMLDEFSPQAKAEMKKFKKDFKGPSEMFVGDHWSNYLEGNVP